MNATRQRRKEARPQELLDSALELFVEKGFAATRSEEVAARAGVSKGTLYLYFPSKEDLFKAVVRSNLSNVIAEGDQAVAEHQGPAADLLRYLMRTWWDRVAQAPPGGISKVIFAEARNFPELAAFYVDEVIAPAHALIGRVLQRGIASGEFRPVPLHEAVVTIVAPTLFMALHKHSLGACPIAGPDLDPERMFETQMDMLLCGLQARATGPRSAAPAAPYNKKLPAG